MIKKRKGKIEVCDIGLYQDRIVVKVGTSTLTNELVQSNFRSFDRLTCVPSDIQNMGEDIEQEEKKENLINTFNALLEIGVIPVLNENDSVNYTEIESDERLFRDNNMLSTKELIPSLLTARTLKHYMIL